MKGKRSRAELAAVIQAEVMEMWTWSLAVGTEGMSGSERRRNKTMLWEHMAGMELMPVHKINTKVQNSWR